MMRKQIGILFVMGILGGCMETEAGSKAQVLSALEMDTTYIFKVWSITADGTVIPHGGGCERIDEGVSSGSEEGFDAGEDGQFVSMSTQVAESAVKVEIAFKEEVVYQKTFSESFLVTGEIEEFQYTTPDDTTFFFQFFGGDSCDVDFLDIHGLDTDTLATNTGV